MIKWKRIVVDLGISQDLVKVKDNLNSDQPGLNAHTSQSSHIISSNGKTSVRFNFSASFAGVPNCVLF